MTRDSPINNAGKLQLYVRQKTMSVTDKAQHHTMFAKMLHGIGSV